MELNALQAPTPLLCYDCSKQTKSKLEDENKMKTHFLCMFSKFICRKITKQGFLNKLNALQKPMPLLYYDCNRQT